LDWPRKTLKRDETEKWRTNGEYFPKIQYPTPDFRDLSRVEISEIPHLLEKIHMISATEIDMKFALRINGAGGGTRTPISEDAGF
jgi:hypothetical protein